MRPRLRVERDQDLELLVGETDVPEAGGRGAVDVAVDLVDPGDDALDLGVDLRPMGQRPPHVLVEIILGRVGR